MFLAAYDVAFKCPDFCGVNLSMSEKKHNLQSLNN